MLYSCPAPSICRCLLSIIKTMTAKREIITMIPTIIVGSTTSDNQADERGGTTSSLWLQPIIPEECCIPPLDD